MTRIANSKVAKVATPAKGTAAKVAADAPVAASSGPVLTLNWGTRGRPESTRASVVSEGFALLSAAVATIAEPKPAKVPANASPRIRAAIMADHAERMAAFTLIRTAVVNGRARANGR